MNIFNECFRDLVFTRCDEKEGFTIYGAGIASGLGGGRKQYVLAFVPTHLAYKRQSKLQDLEWQNLQTRNLMYSYRLKQQMWVIPDDFQDIRLSVVRRTKTHTEYRSSSGNFPFEILLLHNPKKKTLYQYNNNINLSAAILSYEGVFNYTGNPSENEVLYEPDNWFQVHTPYSAAASSSTSVQHDDYELL